jgi:hypothetical protein
MTPANLKKRGSLEEEQRVAEVRPEGYAVSGADMVAVKEELSQANEHVGPTREAEKSHQVATRWVVDGAICNKNSLGPKLFIGGGGRGGTSRRRERCCRAQRST